MNLQAGDTDTVRPLVSDGRGDSSRVLAAMWTQWMDAAAINAESSAMASMPLKPYAHQTTAVYGAMVSQPQLGFLLADEPGTGKTIMAGLYIREMLPQYSQPYFATFWLDPWGFMLEAVCHDDRD